MTSPTGATNSFAPATSTPTMNNGRAVATATLLPNGKVIIAGGLIAGGQEVFGPTNSVGVPHPRLPDFSVRELIVRNGRIWVVVGTH